MEMRREIYTLRSAFAAGPSAPQLTSLAPPHTSIVTHAPYYSPISPVSQTSEMFVQGSSSHTPQHFSPETSNYSIPHYESPPKSASPSISPMLGPLNTRTSSPAGTTSDYTRKRFNDNGHDSDRSASSESPAQGRNHYERKHRTIPVRNLHSIRYLHSLDPPASNA